MDVSTYQLTGLSIRSIRAGISLALLSVVLLLSFDRAEGQESGIQVTSVVTEDWPEIELTIAAVDDAGAPLTGLSADNFSVRAGEDELPISAFTTTSDPTVGLALVLTFDLSGSMAGDPLERARIAGQALIDALGPADQAAIVVFSDDPAIAQDFTVDKAALGQVIDGLAVGGNTGLYSAVQASADLIKRAPLPRRAVILLSDGFDFGAQSPITRDQSLSAAAEGNAVWITIGLGDVTDTQYLEELATVGRGRSLGAPTPDDLLGAYQSAAEVLRQQYVVTLDASGLTPGSANLVLDILVETPDSTLSARSSLMVPAEVLPLETSAPAPTQPAAAETPPQPMREDGSSSILPIAGVAGIVALAASGAWLLISRRRPSPMAADFEAGRFEHHPRAGDFPGIQRAANEDSGAWLELPTGDRYTLREEPITIGFTSDCNIVLLNGTSQRAERARIWRRDGSYMLHNLSPAGSVSISGRAITWAVLEDGDVIDIGGCAFTFLDAAPDVNISKI